MALVRDIKKGQLTQFVEHSAVDCEYVVLTDSDGQKCLQLDTFGSSNRQEKGKKSQSLRLSPEAIVKLKAIFAENGL